MLSSDYLGRRGTVAGMTRSQLTESECSSCAAAKNFGQDLSVYVAPMYMSV